MIFNSIEFSIFAVLFFSLWPVFRFNKLSRWSYIVIASFVFYGWWDWRFLFLIVFSGLVDYFSGIIMVNKPRFKKLILSFSLIANLGSLFIFKYSVFFANILEDLFSILNFEFDLVSRIPEFTLILPVGISFYTFQSLSYTIDIYRNRLKPTKNILHFFSFLAMFPQLVAGPIVRAKDFLEQLNKFRIPNINERWNALKMIIYGLFQKVVIADNLSFLIDSAYEGKFNFSGSFFWWFVVIAFSFQIYADFSGYSLIARGLAKYMGYHFKMNFNHPYLATSMKQFWSRWHISLSTWFRDYVYIPIGGSRNGLLVGLVALFTTMMLSGIWHGANYTFVVWAGLHFIFLLFEKTTKYNRFLRKVPLVLIVIVFFQSTIAWIYFRSPSVLKANEVVLYLFSFSDLNVDFFKFYIDNIIFLFLAIFIEIVIYIKKTNYKLFLFYKRKKLIVDTILMAFCVVMILFLRGEGQQFIYFQF